MLRTPCLTGERGQGCTFTLNAAREDSAGCDVSHSRRSRTVVGARPRDARRPTVPNILEACFLCVCALCPAFMNGLFSIFDDRFSVLSCCDNSLFLTLAFSGPSRSAVSFDAAIRPPFLPPPVYYETVMELATTSSPRPTLSPLRPASLFNAAPHVPQKVVRGIQSALRVGCGAYDSTSPWYNSLDVGRGGAR
ncbi:hypothetical protein C8R45DRAFT_189448 [Mycena sanguinolenta]|nr:hypothetical protein C8R45DRAFT_189448 [Mycena sanguinolenta]